MLPKLKDKVKDNEKSGLVYQIPCKNCEFSYIGETKRSFPTCLGEHKADVQKMNTMTNALAYHAWEKDHNIDWDKSMILKYEENYQKRMCYEACYIKTTKDALNRNLGVNIPKIYDAILTEN
jgi:hypothetical protein